MLSPLLNSLGFLSFFIGLNSLGQRVLSDVTDRRQEVDHGQDYNNKRPDCFFWFDDVEKSIKEGQQNDEARPTVSIGFPSKHSRHSE